MSQTKRWRWADFLFESPLPTTALTVEWVRGYAIDTVSGINSTTVSPAGFAVLTASGDIIASASGDTLSLSQTTTPSRALLTDTDGQYLHDVGLRIRVGDNTSDGSWSLEGINLAYQVLPGLQRRMP